MSTTKELDRAFKLQTPEPPDVTAYIELRAYALGVMGDATCFGAPQPERIKTALESMLATAWAEAMGEVGVGPSLDSLNDENAQLYRDIQTAWGHVPEQYAWMEDDYHILDALEKWAEGWAALIGSDAVKMREERDSAVSSLQRVARERDGALADLEMVKSERDDLADALEESKRDVAARKPVTGDTAMCTKCGESEAVYVTNGLIRECLCERCAEGRG